MHTISLGNTEFEGKNNAYLLEDGDSAALVDTAIMTEPTRQQLQTELSAHGYAFSDIETIVLTHWHPDHAGLAGEIQRAGDATIHVHEADAPLVRRDSETLERFREKQIDRFTEWGIPDDKREELLARLDRNDDIYGHPPDVETIRDGDTIEVAGRTLRTIHAPGHTAGLCCFALEDANEILTGDAVLPVYTPNVGGADVRLEEPLAAYLETLEKLAASEFDRAWPGHRDVIGDPAGRARDIIEHHEERTDRVLSVLEDVGPADPWTVSAELFGGLEGVHIMHGPGEAYAHLDHLANQGVLETRGTQYAFATDATDVSLETTNTD